MLFLAGFTRWTLHWIIHAENRDDLLLNGILRTEDSVSDCLFLSRSAAPNFSPVAASHPASS